MLQSKVPRGEVTRANSVPRPDLFRLCDGQVAQADVGGFPQLPHDGVGGDPEVGPVRVVVLALGHGARPRPGLLSTHLRHLLSTL